MLACTTRNLIEAAASREKVKLKADSPAAVTLATDSELLLRPGAEPAHGGRVLACGKMQATAAS
jgi:hypothetical protein